MVICACAGTIKPAGLDVCWWSNWLALKERGKQATYCLVHLIPLLKCVRLIINIRQYDLVLGQTTDRAWICTKTCWIGSISRMVGSDDTPIISLHSPQKMSSNEPWMKPVGAAVLEIQLGLCRRGGKGIGFGAWVGAKRVSNCFCTLFLYWNALHFPVSFLSPRAPALLCLLIEVSGCRRSPSQSAHRKSPSQIGCLLQSNWWSWVILIWLFAHWNCLVRYS